MDRLILFLVGFVAGTSVGIVFFGGLWWTTQRLTTSSRPGLLLSASLIGRLALVTLVLVVLARTDPVLLIGAVVGLVGARVALTRRAMIERLPVATTPTRPSSGEH